MSVILLCPLLLQPPLSVRLMEDYVNVVVGENTLNLSLANHFNAFRKKDSLIDG